MSRILYVTGSCNVPSCHVPAGRTIPFIRLLRRASHTHSRGTIRVHLRTTCLATQYETPNLRRPVSITAALQTYPYFRWGTLGPNPAAAALFFSWAGQRAVGGRDAGSRACPIPTPRAVLIVLFLFYFCDSVVAPRCGGILLRCAATAV